MTITVEPTLSDQLLEEVDKFLNEIKHQKLVEARVVVDFALDLRLIISKEEVN